MIYGMSYTFTEDWAVVVDVADCDYNPGDGAEYLGPRGGGPHLEAEVPVSETLVVQTTV